MSDELAFAISKRFIARKDVKAIQRPDGQYVVDADYRVDPPTRFPWRKSDLLAHLSGEKTYGHYMLDTESQTKLFAFDIDLNKNDPAKGLVHYWPELPRPIDMMNDPWKSETEFRDACTLREFDPRAAWLDRSHPSRSWTKYQMRMLGGKLASAIHDLLEIPVAVSYTGAKGIHVYGFTGLVSAADAREGALLVLEHLSCFTEARGKSFYAHTNQDPIDGYPNFSIELFPKQDSLDGKDLGNLMRLPLGKNLKSSDPTFFVDLKKPITDLLPHPDPLTLLESGNAWL